MFSGSDFISFSTPVPSAAMIQDSQERGQRAWRGVHAGLT